MVSLIFVVLTLAGQWRYFQKMGHEGWEGIIPFYNTYILFQELYGNGWKFLFLLIPIYNIYVMFKLYIDLAHAFHKSTGFGVGLTLLPFVFSLLLAFGDAVYKDGSYAKVGNDAISRGLDNVSEKLSGNATQGSALRKDPNAIEKIKELSELHKAGVLTDEELEEKKAELLKRI